MKIFEGRRTNLLFAVILSVFYAAGCGSWDAMTTVSTVTGSAPTVLSTSPVDNATGVFPNMKISATFSKAMDPLTITAATFTVKQGATPVSGDVTYSGVTAVFTPTGDLSTSTFYTATISTGAKDASTAGNALAGNFVWSFTTGTASDTTAPTVTGTTNANGATGVAINTQAGATFSEVMDPSTITTATFTLASGGTAVPGLVAYTGVSAVFVPTGNLAPGTLYTATVTTGAKDQAGVALASNYVWSWTTGAAPDTAAPTVTGTTHASGAANVAVNTKVGATFSEAMDPLTITNATFTLTSGGTAVPGMVTYTGVSAVFAPAGNLAPNTLYTVTVTTGAKDLAGNAMAAPFTVSWTTTATPDTTAPTVTGTLHANGATNVAVNTKVGVTFSEAMDPLTITNATFTLTRGGTAVPGLMTYSGVNAVFSPTSDLASSTLYTITVTTGAKDLAGNAMAAPFTISWTTAATLDTTAPTVTGTVNANGATGVAINTKPGATFSEWMDPLTITNATFTLTAGGVAVSGLVTYSGVNAVFSPTGNLAPNTLYTATVTTGAKDLAGNAMALNRVWSWTTAAALDTTAPRVTGTVNANGATGVAINTKPGATFSEAMDHLTITNATFTLTTGGAAVPGLVSYSGVNAVFTPVGNFANNTLYTATITTGAKDLAGNALVGNYVWSWTTAAIVDAIPPTVTLVHPADLATGVAVNSTVSATFSEAINPLTLTPETFMVQASGPPLGARLSGMIDYNLLTKIVTFTPTSNLAASTQYTATITTGVKSLEDNALVVDKVWSFTTGGGSVLAPGTVALGSAATFGIMATAAITSTGNSVINGDVSLDPGTSMTGFPPGVVNGTVHVNDTVSAQARIDLLTSYNFAKNLPPGTTIGGGADLGALYPTGIPPGTYTSGSTMLVSTPLTLDAGGNANAVWVFQIGSSLTTGANVTLANGAQAKNVFWVPTSDATIGVGTIFYGTIVSGRDVTAVTGSTINGRILAGAITAGTIALQNTTVNVPAP